MNHSKKFAFAAFATMLLGVDLRAATITNADVAKMISAGLSPEIVVASIHGNPDRHFDTSPDALVALKKSGVPDSVLNEMLSNPASAASTNSNMSSVGKLLTSGASSRFGPESFTLIEGEKETPLAYSILGMRTAARGLGFGGIAVYNVLKGSHASLRLKNSSPTFLVTVPNNAQVASYLTIASFAIRGNDSREVLVGGGFSSVSTGVHPDRVVPYTSEKLQDQTRAPDGYTLYKISLLKPLAPGEYGAGVGAPGQTGSPGSPPKSSCYDFGID